DACSADLHQGVHAEIDRERLLAMEAPQRGKDQALGDTSLRGIDRPDRPRLAHPGCVPSTANRIARCSSSDSVCGDAPSDTGLAKIRVVTRPCRLLMTTPSRRGIDRPAGPRLAHPGCAPSPAIRIARGSSSDSVCGDAPSDTGLAKTRVFARPCRLLMTTPSRRSSSSAIAKL